MRVCLIVVFLSLISLNSNAQIDSVVNIELYQLVQKTPEGATDIVNILDHFEKIAQNDSEILEMSFYWISLNIKYDLELSRKTKLTSSDISIERTISTGKTICSGYSELLCEFAFYSDIECRTVEGIGQDYLEPKSDSLETNHAWNVVLIDDKWRLVDPTWGSGSYMLMSEDYIQQVDMRYFLADPKFLLIDHFPKDSKWQLIDDPITYSEFRNEYWSEMRFRKFNQLMNEDEYQAHLRMMKNALKPDNRN